MSLEGTGDTPYNLATPYITPYIDYLPNPTKKRKPLQLLTLSLTIKLNSSYYDINTLFDFNIDSVIISRKALSLLDEVKFQGDNNFMYLEDNISSKRFRAFLF